MRLTNIISRINKPAFKKGLIISSLSINISILALLFTPIVNWLYYPFKVEPKLKKCDAIVLLSSAKYTESIFGRNSYQRMVHASKLYEKKFAPKIIICGGGTPSLARAMKGFMVDVLKCPEESILLEEKSTDTNENLKFAKEIMRNEAIDSILLVTSHSHMFRSMAICKKLNINAFPAPVPLYEPGVRTIIQRSKFCLDIFREYIAVVYFKLRGWI